MALIGICGRIGSGKTEVARIIQGLYPEMNWQEKGFADKLRQVVSIMTGISVDDMKKQEVKQRFLPKFGMTLRQLLQKVGEYFRKMNEDVWVDALMAGYVVDDNIVMIYGKIPPPYPKNLGTGKFPNWLIPDCRHVNEMEAIKSRQGTCIRIVRPDNPYPQSNHISETALDGVEMLTIINDGSLEQLRLRVKEVFDPIVKNLGK